MPATEGAICKKLTHKILLYWSFSRGQYIPTTAVDQVAATLAKWMGVTDTNAMNTI